MGKRKRKLGKLQRKWGNTGKMRGWAEWGEKPRGKLRKQVGNWRKKMGKMEKKTLGKMEKNLWGKNGEKMGKR